MANEPLPEGLTTKDLECVMLDLPPFDIHEAYGPDLNEDDFYYGDKNGPLKFAQGPVAEEVAHVTLLFGIHPSERYEMDVYGKLLEWTMPENILLKEVGFFPSSVEGEDYYAIIAHVVPSASLVAANAALKELPYTNTLPYKPHVTLAYIKGSADVDEWVRRLNSAFGYKFVVPWELNLGKDD